MKPPFILTDKMQEMMAFQKYWPPVLQQLLSEIPVRFAPMAEPDLNQFGHQAFHLCHQSALYMDDELHFVCVVMTLFGHRFYADPRYFALSNLLFDKAHRARVRRAKPLLSALIDQVWGHPTLPKGATVLAANDLAAIRFGKPVSGAFAPCESPLPAFAYWLPWPLDQHFFVAHADAIRLRLNVDGPHALNICFWAVWTLGLDFDCNPQFQWWIRAINAAGPDPARRYRRLVDWLHHLASGAADPMTEMMHSGSKA